MMQTNYFLAVAKLSSELRQCSQFFVTWYRFSVPKFIVANSANRSSHLAFGRPRLRRPSGVHIALVIHRPSARLAACPAHLHILLRCSSTQSFTPTLRMASVASRVVRWIHSTQLSICSVTFNSSTAASVEVSLLQFSIGLRPFPRMALSIFLRVVRIVCSLLAVITQLAHPYRMLGVTTELNNRKR